MSIRDRLFWEDQQARIDETAKLANSPATVCKLLRAIAGGRQAIDNRHDTILIAAVEMIEAFERKTK